jgi:hypothetical protein
MQRKRFDLLVFVDSLVLELVLILVLENTDAGENRMSGSLAEGIRAKTSSIVRGRARVRARGAYALRQRREGPQPAQANAKTTAPQTISVAPIAPRKLMRSPRKIIESKIAATTLSLSTGATLATSPTCNARK